MQITNDKLGELLAQASEAGAQRALAHLGLSDQSAAKDMADPAKARARDYRACRQWRYSAAMAEARPFAT